MRERKKQSRDEINFRRKKLLGNLLPTQNDRDNSIDEARWRRRQRRTCLKKFCNQVDPLAFHTEYRIFMCKCLLWILHKYWMQTNDSIRRTVSIHSKQHSILFYLFSAEFIRLQLLHHWPLLITNSIWSPLKTVEK